MYEVDTDVKNTSEGYIILARATYKHSKTWQHLTPAQKVVMITLIMMANHTDGQWWDDWKKVWVPIKRGQLITSLDKLRQACGKGISIKNIRTALLNLEKMGFLANQSAKHYRLVTLVNYDLYQSQDNYTAKQTANARQSLGKGPATNKHVKHGKHDKQDINIFSEFEAWWKDYPNKLGKDVARNYWAKHRKAGVTVEQLTISLDNYKKFVNGKDKQFILHGSTFLGPSGRWKDFLETKHSETYTPPREDPQITELRRRQSERENTTP